MKPLYKGLRTYLCSDTTMYSYLVATRRRSAGDEYTAICVLSKEAVVDWGKAVFTRTRLVW
jgi:hypothetical protein